MKNSTNAFLIFCMLLILCSCNNEPKDHPHKKKLAVVAPSSADIPTAEQVKRIALETVNTSAEIEITKVDYLPVKMGFATLVWYKTKAGLAGNFAYVRYPKIAYKVKQLVMKKGSVNSQLKKGDITLTCNGTCGCVVGAEIKPDGTILFLCGCDDCTAIITTSRN
jgi:hypothetical protein